MSIVTPECVAAAPDDMPPVLIVGSGSGHQRAARADGGIVRFIAAARQSGRMVAFDRIAIDPGALEEALEMTGFDTAGLLGRRQVCVLRRVDELSADDVARIKRLATSSHQWWVMSAGSTGALRALTGFFLHVRVSEESEAKAATPPDAALRMLTIRDVPHLTNVSDVSPAVASGATLAELSESFRRFVVRRLPPEDAFEMTAKLDVDIRTNKRPLMLSALIEDAVREVEERTQASQMPGG